MTEKNLQDLKLVHATSSDTLFAERNRLNKQIQTSEERLSDLAFFEQSTHCLFRGICPGGCVCWNLIPANDLDIEEAAKKSCQDSCKRPEKVRVTPCGHQGCSNQEALLAIRHIKKDRRIEIHVVCLECHHIRMISTFLV